MSPILSVSFVLLVAILYSLMVLAVAYANGRSGQSARVSIVVMRTIFGGFLLVTGLAAMQNAFADFSTIPPKVAFAIVPGALGILVLSFLPQTGRWISRLPHWWLIAAQSFRIFVEIQLFFLAKTPLLPKIMTFEGTNFDVLTGIAAVVLGIQVRKAERGAGITPGLRNAIVAFNVMGILLVSNVVITGLLAVPTKFQMIFTDPPNTAIGHFPFVWLPAFVVPYAYMLHILSFRKLRQTRLA